MLSDAPIQMGNTVTIRGDEYNTAPLQPPVPPPPPPYEPEMVLAEVEEDEHDLTHIPKRDDCEACQAAKMQRKQKRRRGAHLGPRPVNFGDQLTKHSEAKDMNYHLKQTNQIVEQSKHQLAFSC